VFGKEVIQLYIEDIESYLPRPKKELAAFKKVSLAPNETKTITFELTKKDFSVYSSSHHDFLVEEGMFNLSIGRNVRDIELTKKIEITTKELFRNDLTLAHPLKNFFIYKPHKANKISTKYREFPWYEIEEPALRVLKRIKKEYNLTDLEFKNMLDDLMK